MPELFHFEPLFHRLSDAGHHEWVNDLKTRCANALNPARHGHLSDWIRVWNELPDQSAKIVDPGNGRVTVQGDISDNQRSQLRSQLMTWHPWRKGPFDVFGIHIDTEWRSDWKWDRLKNHIDFRNKSVLDVGCGNGYYGWRMLAAGAEQVMGLDPLLLYYLLLMMMTLLSSFSPSSSFLSL